LITRSANNVIATSADARYFRLVIPNTSKYMSWAMRKVPSLPWLWSNNYQGNNIPSSDGIAPMILLKSSSNTVNDDNIPSSVDILPVISLKSSWRLVNDDNIPNSDGTVHVISSKSIKSVITDDTSPVMMAYGSCQMLWEIAQKL